MLEGAAATSDATELRHLLLDVSDACLSREVVARLPTDRMSRRLAPLLALAKLLLGNRSPDLGRDTTSDRRSYADLGVSAEDVYKVLAYAHRYATDSAVLIYPHHAAVGHPGLPRDFVVQGGGASRVVVRVVTLDLARLERLPGQVEEAVAVC